MTIGEIIRQKIREDGRTAKVICEEVGMSRGNLDKIYHKDSISTDLLAKFCDVLKYDFFQHVNPMKTVGKRNGGMIVAEEEHVYGETSIELRACRDQSRALERELLYMDQSIADLKNSLRDKEEIIGLQKDKIMLLEQLLSKGKGK